MEVVARGRVHPHLARRRSRNMKDLLPVLEAIARQQKPLLIIAEDIEGEALATLVVNKLRGTLHCAAVKAPGLRRSPQGDAQGHRRSSPAARSSRRSSASSSRTSRSAISAAPSASRSTRTTPRSSTAPARRTRSRAVSRRSAPQIENTTSDYDREKLQERLAKLVGGVAVIKVGAATETEMKEKKARVEDALHATRAAVEEGIVPGGGVALIRAQKALDEPRRSATSSRFGVAHHPPRDRGAPPPDRRRTPATRARSSCRRCAKARAPSATTPRPDKYGDLVADGRHRPGQGRALRAAERGQRRGPDAHDRGAHRREAEGGEGSGGGGHAHGGGGDF